MLFHATWLFPLAVLANWKTIGLTFLLEREREKQEAALAKAGVGGVPAGKVKNMDELERLVVPLDA